MSEREQHDDDSERREKSAAHPDPKKHSPEQDGTDNSTFDTDEHSDAPGPFGTG